MGSLSLMWFSFELAIWMVGPSRLRFRVWLSLVKFSSLRPIFENDF